MRPAEQLLALAHFQDNLARVPWEVRAPYVGQHVAWDNQGTRILEAAPTLAELVARLRQAGVDPGGVVFDFIDDPGESQFS